MNKTVDYKIIKDFINGQINTVQMMAQGLPEVTGQPFLLQISAYENVLRFIESLEKDDIGRGT